ncbi:MAG: DsrE family protein [Prochloraceae cyanobacterium]|nr:DsrE family protein [Prochloraceae cyanobacterium]
MKALQIVQSAYRCNSEEQDDPVIWFALVLKGANADVDIVLRENAVNYAISDQNAPPLSFGQWQQTQPPRIDRDLQQAIDKGLNVYVVNEDVRDRGISKVEMLDGIKSISRQDLASLFDNYDLIWHW